MPDPTTPTWRLVPVEPTEAMWDAGRDPVMYRDMKHYRPASAPVPAWQISPDGTVENDTSKGTTAVHVWRAMIAAAPAPQDLPPVQLPELTDEQIDDATRASRDELMDHIYEYGTTAEGQQRHIRRIARAAIAADRRAGGR